MLHKTTGVLRYHDDPLKLIVVVDPGIGKFYRSLIPKWMTANPQRYPTHISVVRNETPDTTAWRRHEGREVEFLYHSYIHCGRVYYWLNAFSPDLCEIRSELGLPTSSEFTRPPDSRHRCFHITLANRKLV